jgi:hypothetical protein
MAQAPTTLGSQAKKRKAVMKSEETLDDDEDGDSSYKPSSGAEKPAVRKKSAPRAASRSAKRTKPSLQSEHDQHEEEAVVLDASNAPTPAPKTDTKAEFKSEEKTKSEPGSANGIALLNDGGAAGVSPHDQGHGQAQSPPQDLDTGAVHPFNLGHHQSGLSVNMDDPSVMQLHFPHSGMISSATSGTGSFLVGQQLNLSQLAAFPAHRNSQPRPQHLAAGQLATEQVQGYQLNQLQTSQMLPYQMSAMLGCNLPFGYMAHMQSNEGFPAAAYDGFNFVGQTQLGHYASYGHAEDESFRGRFDGQDERDLDSCNVKRETTLELNNEAGTE